MKYKIKISFYCGKMLLTTLKTILWEAFRREAAKDILCAMIHHQNSTDPIEVSIAIDIADELIKQLKEEIE